jgi:hypothetical protein
VSEKQLAETYGTIPVRLIGWPVATPAGNGWWRHVWQVEHEATRCELLEALPPPPPDALALVVGLCPSGDRRLRLEVLSHGTRLISPEVGYVSLVMQALRDRLGPLRIDGHLDHPIVRMARA